MLELLFIIVVLVLLFGISRNTKGPRGLSVQPCPYCRMPMHGKATVCPHCQRESRLRPIWERWGKHVIIGMVAASALCAITNQAIAEDVPSQLLGTWCLEKEGDYASTFNRSSSCGGAYQITVSRNGYVSSKFACQWTSGQVSQTGTFLAGAKCVSFGRPVTANIKLAETASGLLWARQLECHGKACWTASASDVSNQINVHQAANMYLRELDSLSKHKRLPKREQEAWKKEVDIQCEKETSPIDVSNCVLQKTLDRISKIKRK